MKIVFFFLRNLKAKRKANAGAALQAFSVFAEFSVNKKTVFQNIIARSFLVES